MDSLIHSSIFKRFLAIYIAVTTPFLTISLFFSLRGEDMLRDGLSREMDRKIAYVAQHFEAEYARVAGLQQSLSLDSDLEALVSRASAMDWISRIGAVSRIQEKLRDYKTINPHIYEMSVYIPGMERTISAPYGQRFIYDRFPSGREREASLPEKGGVSLEGERISVFLVPSRGAPGCVIETVISADYLFRDGNPGMTSGDGGYFLYSEDGGAIAAAEENRELARDIAASLPPGGGATTILSGGIKYFVTSSPFAWPDTLLASFTNENRMLAPLSIYRGWFFAAILLFLVMTVLYAYSVQRYLNKPIFMLLRHFKKLEDGNMDSRIHLTRGDEFGVLYAHFNTMADKLSAMIAQVYKQTIYTQKAELKQLQAQINPHFLYNSYFLLHRLIKRGDPHAVEFSKFLGEYFKYITKNDGNSTFYAEEYDHAYLYAQIQAVRFEGRIRVEFSDMPAEMARLAVPRLILQPILENAFLHGLEKEDGTGLLRVEHQVGEGAYQVLIRNTGPPLSGEALEKLRSEFSGAGGPPTDCSGLANIHRRLRLTFGEGSGLEISDGFGGGESGAEVKVIILRKETPCESF